MEGISPEAAAAFYRLEKLTGPLTVTSGYRSPEHNKKVGGAKGSQHLGGNALDIDVTGMPIPERVQFLRHADEAGFTGTGIYENSIHLDVGPERAWGPSYSKDSLPDWYLEAFGGGSTGGTAATASSDGGNKLSRFLTLASAMPKWRNSLRNT